MKVIVDGRHLDTKGLQQWIDKENKYLKSIELTELLDFRQLDWKRDPDKFIELGGRYFRESLLGTHFFGYAVDAIKGPGGVGVSQFFGTVTGMAKFYNQKDDVMGSILAGGKLASGHIGWDMLVEKVSGHLPTLSRQALFFANSVMSNDVKARVFERMKDEYLKGTEQIAHADPSEKEAGSSANFVPGSSLNRAVK
jgi:hypothetical protein